MMKKKNMMIVMKKIKNMMIVVMKIKNMMMIVMMKIKNMMIVMMKIKKYDDDSDSVDDTLIQQMSSFYELLHIEMTVQ